MNAIRDRKPKPKRLPRPSEDCRKAAAISAYNYGVLPLFSCARLFSNNPKWRHA
jgi:hypothetical protein